MRNRIKQIRRDKAMSQSAFGKALGVSRDVISNYEMGRVEPTDLFINHLCSTFHINEKWLRSGTGEMYFTSKETILEELVGVHGLDERETAVIKAFLELSPQGRAGVLEYVENLIEFNKKYTASLSDIKHSFRAARSQNNNEPECIEYNEERARELHKAPKLSSDNEL